MIHAENIDADLDAIIADQFPDVKEVSSEDLDKKYQEHVIETSTQALQKLWEVKLYGANLKYPTHNFQMEQVLYDKNKYFQFVITVLHPLDETERMYNMFFHIKDFWLFNSDAVEYTAENARLIDSMVIKVENKHGTTKLTCGIQPEDANWLMSRVFEFGINWVVSLIHKNACSTKDPNKIIELVE